MVRILNGIQNLDVYVRFLNGRPFENRPPKWIPDLGSPLCFTISWKSYKMQNTLGNLNTRLVQVKSCSIAKWSSIQMPLNEYRSYFNVVFRPPLEYWIDIQMVIYIPQTLPFEYQTSECRTSKSLLFRCCRYSDPHCTVLQWTSNICIMARY